MTHKRFLLIMAILLVFVAGVAQRPSNAQNAAPRRPRIAVLDFDYATVHTYSAAIFGSDVDIGKGIADLHSWELALFQEADGVRCAVRF